MSCCWHWDFPHPRSHYATSVRRTGYFRQRWVALTKNVPRTSSGGESGNHQFQPKWRFIVQPPLLKTCPSQETHMRTERGTCCLQDVSATQPHVSVTLLLFLTRGGIISHRTRFPLFSTTGVNLQVKNKVILQVCF